MYAKGRVDRVLRKISMSSSALQVVEVVLVGLLIGVVACIILVAALKTTG